MKIFTTVVVALMVVSLSCFLMELTMVATGTKETSALWLIPMCAVGLIAGGVVSAKVEL